MGRFAAQREGNQRVHDRLALDVRNLRCDGCLRTSPQIDLGSPATTRISADPRDHDCLGTAPLAGSIVVLGRLTLSRWRA
jgi:hypothetical protein